MSVTLMGCLLQGPLEHQVEVLGADQAATAALVEGLAQCIGSKQLLTITPQHPTTEAAQMPGVVVQGNAAQLQLDALHLLLLLLPIIANHADLNQAARLLCATPPPCQKGGAHAKRGAWTSAVRRGLAWMLRSRVSIVQKHSALQAAAQLVMLLGEGWLVSGGEEEEPEVLL
jgi:hypothetical protein